MKGYQIFIVALCLLIACISCRRTVEPGLETSVSGIVFDPNKQKLIPGVYVEAVESRRGGLYGRIMYWKVLDSTTTGADGRYNIKFKTTGRGQEYTVNVRAVKVVQNYSAHTIQPGTSNVADFLVWQTHTLKAILHVVNNPKPPLRVSSQYASAEIPNANNDTTVYLKVIPNHVNYIQFTIVNPDSARYYNSRIDTINPTGFADTFSMSFQLDPSTFPRR